MPFLQMMAPLPKKRPYTHFVIRNGSHINVQHILGVLQPYMAYFYGYVLTAILHLLTKLLKSST